MHCLQGNALISIVVAIYCAQCGIAQPTRVPEVKNDFEKNWLIQGKDEVAYSRKTNRHREFSYTSCDTTNKYCNVTLTICKSSSSYAKTCKFDLDPIESTQIGVASLFLPDDSGVRALVAVEWYREGRGHLDSFLGFLNMTNCKNNANHFIGSIDESTDPSHVIVYRYPKIKTSASMRHERRLIRELTFGQPVQYGRTNNRKYIRMNHSWIGEEQPVELESSDGFFSVAINDVSGSEFHVLYANLTTDQTYLIDSIGAILPTHTYPKTSGAYNKYGLCWTTVGKDNRVDCTQFDVDGRKRIERVSLELAEPIDWFAVHNLREAAMLLVTGQCHNDKCERFKVTKIHANGDNDVPFEITNLNAVCSRQPMHLTLDIVEDLSKGQICFNFVCLNEKYKVENSSDKVSTTVQYRRHCVTQDYVDRMN